jgi:sirohydrochlorin ferrochelatase
MEKSTTLLLIAHGSRRMDANDDLAHLAQVLAQSGEFLHVQASYLELCPPTIIEGGIQCVTAGATCVVMVPYFLSAGVHVVEDLTAAQFELAKRFPTVAFLLAEPLGRHPLLAQIVTQRVSEALDKKER